MKVKRAFAAWALAGVSALGVVVAAPSAQADIHLYEWSWYNTNDEGWAYFDCCDADFSDNTFANGRPLDNKVTSIKNVPIESNEFTQKLNLYRNAHYTGWMINFNGYDYHPDLGQLGLNNMASSVRYETE